MESNRFGKNHWCISIKHFVKMKNPELGQAEFILSLKVQKYESRTFEVAN